MATVRIYKIASLLGLSSQEAMLLLLKDTGIEVKSASGAVEEIVAIKFVVKQAKIRQIPLPPLSKMFEEIPTPSRWQGQSPRRASGTAPVLRPRLLKKTERANVDQTAPLTAPVKPVSPSNPAPSVTTTPVPPSASSGPPPSARTAAESEPGLLGAAVLSDKPAAELVSLRTTFEQSLELLRVALVPFIATKMQKEYGNAWQDRALGALTTIPQFKQTTKTDIDDDLSVSLQIVTKFWDSVFRRYFTDRFARTLFDDARLFRNADRHGQVLGLEDVFRTVDTIHRLLKLMGSPDVAQVDRMKDRLISHWSDRRTMRMGKN